MYVCIFNHDFAFVIFYILYPVEFDILYINVLDLALSNRRRWRTSGSENWEYMSLQTDRQALQFAVSLKFRQCTVNYFCSAHVTKAQADRDKHTHTHARATLENWTRGRINLIVVSFIVFLFGLHLFMHCLLLLCLWSASCCFFSFIGKLQTFDDCAQTARLLRDSNRRAESTTARKRCSYKTNSKLSHWRTL